MSYDIDSFDLGGSFPIGTKPTNFGKTVVREPIAALLLRMENRNKPVPDSVPVSVGVSK